MAISKPLLPAIAGYVEAVDGFGNHYYKPTSTTTERAEDAQEVTDLADAMIEVGGIVAEQDDRLSVLEDAVVELASLIGGAE